MAHFKQLDVPSLYAEPPTTVQGCCLGRAKQNATLSGNPLTKDRSRLANLGIKNVGLANLGSRILRIRAGTST